MHSDIHDNRAISFFIRGLRRDAEGRHAIAPMKARHILESQIGVGPLNSLPNILGLVVVHQPPKRLNWSPNGSELAGMETKIRP
jgi:hypothetical protein